ncbi:MAG: ParB/Srx family N-terminal domain-containing protein [Acidimicrobiaceae bacterium]|nr:ParB/Srx family N-terminal domain-containing protein [Acidimicrobiaceae bacterium]
MRRDDIQIGELLLDAENPRHGEVEDQGAALERLVVIRPQHLRSLTEDIAKNGLHPGLGFLVFPTEDGRFVVLDGNRRLAAIKLLTQPDSAPASWRPITTEIEVDLHSFERLPCTILDTREEGRLWLERMHTGQMNGVGVVQWPPMAQHRFSPRNDQRGRGAAALAWLSSRTEPGETDLHEAIETVEGEITTFGRLVQTRAVRPILGHDFKGSELVPTEGTSIAVLYERLIAAVKDLAGGKDVNDLRTIPQRVAYAHELAGSSDSDEEGDDEGDRRAQEEPTEQAVEESEGEQSTGGDDQAPANEGKLQEATKSKGRKRSSQPKTSVLDAPLPDSFKPRIVLISEELCALNVHDNPNAVAVLLRLLIEMTTEQCRRAENLPRQGDLREHIERVVQRVQTSQDQKDKVFHGVTVSLSRPKDRDHTMNFNQHVHNVDYHPVPTDLINTAENYRPYFERIGQRLAGKAAS